MFTMVQHFPEDRILQIRTFSSVHGHKLQRLLIVWAHHILGLNVVLCHEDGGVFGRFGVGPENVVIAAQDDRLGSEICLLDGTHQELFRISESLDDPEITADERISAGGFGARYLGGINHSGEIIHRVLKHVRHILVNSVKLIFFSRCHKAATFLFGNLMSSIPPKNRQGSKSPLVPGYEEESVQPLARALYAFAHIENLEGLQDLPITLRGLRDLEWKNCNNSRVPFEYMVRLLLGSCNIKGLVLVSCRGWSVYTNILALPDPSEASAPIVRVSRGMPSRAGERKQFIIDAISPGRIQTPDINDESPSVLSSARLACDFDVTEPRWLVGTSSSTFDVSIKLELEPYHRKITCGQSYCRRMFKVGLLKLEALALQASKIPPCYHQEASLGSQFNVPSGCLVFSSSCRFEVQERTGMPIFLPLSAGSSSARWLTLLLVDHEGESYLNPGKQSPLEHIYLRDKNGCPKCCIKYVRIAMENKGEVNGVRPSLSILVL